MIMATECYTLKSKGIWPLILELETLEKYGH